RPDDAAAYRLHAVEDPEEPLRAGRGAGRDGGMAGVGGLRVLDRRGVRHLRRARDVLSVSPHPEEAALAAVSKGEATAGPASFETRYALLRMRVCNGVDHDTRRRMSLRLGSLQGRGRAAERAHLPLPQLPEGDGLALFCPRAVSPERADR